MTRDDIIRMAREAGLTVGTNISGVTLVGSPAHAPLNLAHINIDELAIFAALVAAAEREACAKLVEGYGVWEHNHVLAAAIRQRGQA